MEKVFDDPKFIRNFVVALETAEDKSIVSNPYHPNYFGRIVYEDLTIDTIHFIWAGYNKQSYILVDGWMHKLNKKYSERVFYTFRERLLSN